MFTLILEGICPHHSPGIYPDAGKELTSPGTETLKWGGPACVAWASSSALLSFPKGLNHPLGAGGWETPFGWAIYHDLERNMRSLLEPREL